MTFFLTKLWQYFGIVGILSILAWLASLIILPIGACCKQGTRHYWCALAVALVGLQLAWLNSHFINQIRYDETAAIEAGRDIGRRLAAKESGTNVVADLADPGLALTNDNAEAREFDYRAGGKVEREEGKRKGDEVAGVETPAQRKEEEPLGRTLEAEDVHRANGWDKLNLFGARFSVWLALLVVVLNYLRRLNTPFDACFPLPISGPWLDALYPKDRLVQLPDNDLTRIRKCLEHIVRKGETFIYFGEDNPWPQRDALPRLVFRGREFFPVRKVHCTGDGDPLTAVDVMESAWFNRYCFTVEGSGLSKRWLRELERFLIRRLSVRAAARRTVNIIAAIREPLPPDCLAELEHLCRETNHRMVVLSRDHTSVTPLNCVAPVGLAG